MLKFWKKNSKGKEYLYEEKPENENVELTGENIETLLSDSNDIVIRELYVNGNEDQKVTLCYVDGLINNKMVSDDILKPLMQEVSLREAKNTKKVIELIEHGALYYVSQVTRNNINDTIKDILNGFAALIFSKEKIAVTFDVKGFEKRGIQEPSAENVIKGARDSFIEVMRVNTSMIRRRVRTQNLKIKQLVIGQETLTPVSICYIDGITNETLIKEVTERLQSIDIDSVLATGAIEEFITDNKLSTFPQVVYTERPDKFCANLMEGRVGILIDGMPTSFIVPGTLNQFMQAPEDYSKNFFVASMISIIRYLSIIMTLILPGFYISITTFHQELIPTELIHTIIASKEGVPFPIFAEVLIMLLSFEVLLEAGLRMPRTIGQAVSIVGALVVGQAAVEAKMVSPAVVIVVAITAISGFTAPNQDFANALRLWRFILTIFSAISGLFGLSIGLILLVLHLAYIETFGVPYLSPYVGNEGKEITLDTILRLPIWLMT
jgi:spore germination protein KA